MRRTINPWGHAGGEKVMEMGVEAELGKEWAREKCGDFVLSERDGGRE